jgi:hypothetical protein
MRLFGHEFGRRAKTLVILAAVLLVSAGLCGLQLRDANSTHLIADAIEIPLGVVELVVMFASSVGIVVVSIAWGAEALYQRYGKAPKDEVQKLVEGKDDGERKDPR